MAKEIISESMLRKIISEEISRFSKKLTLEAEKKKILKRLQEIHLEEEAMEEGLFGPSKQEVEANRQAFVKELDALLATAPQGKKILPSKEDILKQAASASIPFKGSLSLKPAKRGDYLVLAFAPNLTKLQQLGTIAGGALRDQGKGSPIGE